MHRLVFILDPSLALAIDEAASGAGALLASEPRSLGCPSAIGRVLLGRHSCHAKHDRSKE